MNLPYMCNGLIARRYRGIRLRQIPGCLAIDVNKLASQVLCQNDTIARFLFAVRLLPNLFPTLQQAILILLRETSQTGGLPSICQHIGAAP